MKANRRKFSAEQKIEILRKRVIEKVPVSEVCDHYGIHSTQFYQWQKILLEKGSTAFEKGCDNLKDQPCRRLKGKSQRCKFCKHLKRLKKENLKIREQLQAVVQTQEARKRHSWTAPEKALRVIQVVQNSNLPAVQTLELLSVPRSTYYNWIKKEREGDMNRVRKTKRISRVKEQDPVIAEALFEILHSPPSTYDINRTSWRMKDLRRILLEEKNLYASYHTIRRIIRAEGYRWRKAKTVLTSTDPEYREKLDHIKAILSTLGEKDRFFSIDEFGPFAIKMIGGRRLVAPGTCHRIPQFQKSKGSLIVTGALELSTNQVTHFYSKKKDTGEMIRLLGILLGQYTGCRKLYLSWDAGSWHASRALYERVEEVNGRTYRRKHHTPRVELAPLPASAQFLNVIESVFSGMARAVIHNSNYASVKDAKKAIDRHFGQRNAFFRKHPKRAGKKIWGEELVPSKFSESQNCKDPKWQRK